VHQSTNFLRTWVLGGAWWVTITISVLCTGSTNLHAAPAKRLFDFEGAAAARGWEGSDGTRLETVVGPVGPKDGPDRPAGNALQVKAGKGGWVRTAADRTDDWSSYSDLSFWVYRSEDEARRQPRSILEVRLRAEGGKGHLWRRVDVTHTGWKRLVLPLRWFRPGDNRIPPWEKVARLEVYSRSEADLLLDTIQLQADRPSGPAVTVDDLKEVGFPDVPSADVRSIIADDLWLLTNSPDLDLDGLAKHLRKVADRVRTDLKLPPVSKVQPPCLLVFASRQQYQGFTVRLADRLNADAQLPGSDGFTTFGIGTSYFDPVAGQVRPVFTHEFVHSLIERALRIASTGEWFHEGMATYYQLQFHPQPSLQDLIRKRLPSPGDRTILRDLCDGRRILASEYWYAATLIEMLLTKERFRVRVPGLVAALGSEGRSELTGHIQNVLNSTWADVERQWQAHCMAKYVAEPEVIPGWKSEFAPNTEVHAIGVAGPAGEILQWSDLTDWKGLAERLRVSESKGDKPARRVWNYFSDNGKAILSDPQRVAALSGEKRTDASERDRGEVYSTLRKLMKDSTAFAPDDLADLNLSTEIITLLKKPESRAARDTYYLNRLLLSAVFPTHVAPLKYDPRVVVVQVRHANPIVLVLASQDRCIWHVTAEAGTKIEGIVLTGYEAQEVTGIRVPTLYRARVSPDGKKSGVPYVVAFKNPSVGLDSLRDFVLDTIRLPLKSFQCALYPMGRTFKVPAQND
jgi:hypothetical protein